MEGPSPLLDGFTCGIIPDQGGSLREATLVQRGTLAGTLYQRCYFGFCHMNQLELLDADTVGLLMESPVPGTTFLNKDTLDEILEFSFAKLHRNRRSSDIRAG